jgi:aminomethyltransferase
VQIVDRSAALVHLALQGPQSPYILEKVLAPHAKKFKPRAVKEIRTGDHTLFVSRTGYTGEHGYELMVPGDHAEPLWDSIMEHGREFGILPCGLAARDILRIEMGYRLYGSDLDETHTPVDAGLERFVDLGKDFIGRDSIEAVRFAGTSRLFVGFSLMDKTAPRCGGSIFSENREIGMVTSGAVSPSFRKGIGLGYVATRYAEPGQEIDIEIRDSEYPARIAALPFYRRK